MEQKSFADIFEDVTKQAVKIQKKDYLPTGRYPIIDQGQEWCAGYTDREDGLFQDVPAYIFGDHTRIIKYTDEPFYLGADGVKLLKLREGIQANPRFFYYALKSQRIPDTGYNRHFKWLKESLYHVPTLNEQTHIADTLDTLSTLITLCKTKIFLFDELVKSRFIEMFGDPVTNPHNMPMIKLKNLSTLITKGASPNWQGYAYSKDTNQTLFITSENVRENFIDISQPKYIENAFNVKQKRSLLQKGDVLINIVGASIGRAAKFDIDVRANINQAVALVRIQEASINREYLLQYLNSEKALQMYDSMKSDVARANLSLQDIGNLDILMPPRVEQDKYANFTQQVDKSKLMLRQLLEQQRTLKAALMQEYFAAH